MANAQVQVDFLENGRGGQYLLHAGYKFSINYRRNGRCYWKCVDRQCTARVTTVNNIPVVFTHNHNHLADFVGLAAFAFVNSVKERCRDEVTPIPTIYDEELGKLRDRSCDDSVVEMIGRVPTFYTCKTALYKVRASVRPKLPVTHADIDLEGAWAETSAGERFLLCDDTNNRGQRIIVFATDDGLAKLCASTVIFGDGTFFACPKLFTQLYSLHGSINGTVLPLLFALLPNKSEQTYARFCGLLADAITQRNSVLTPETILIDFEVAARNAFQAAFPMSTLKGCFFHYKQCILRRTQKCGLAARYQGDDANLQQFVRRAAVLPLVPMHRVEDVWFNALEENDDISPQVTQFADYVTETWVEGQDYTFWNHYDNDGPRTTNNVEGWHNKLNKLCPHAHPNIFVMVKLLQDIQATNEAKIFQLLAGGTQRPRQKKYRNLNSRLQRLKDRLRNGQLGVIQFADAASHLVNI